MMNKGPWQPKFLWRPMKIKGRWRWLTTVYCRERHQGWPPRGWDYGDEFDVLRDS